MRLSKFIPVQKGEYKTLAIMGLMLLLILMNYNLLRALKDSLIAPNIGPEAIAFVDTYLVIPGSIIFALIYSYCSHFLSFRQCFVWIFGAFLAFFILFALALYPNHDSIHPDPKRIQALIAGQISFFGVKIAASHFKWILLVCGKWIFALLGLATELFGSIFIFLFYWQLANRITVTERAKRLYPAYNFIGHIGTVVAGIYMSQICKSVRVEGVFVQMTTWLVIGNLAIAYLLFSQMRFEQLDVGIERAKKKLDLRTSFQILFTSRYLWLIAMLVFFYGTSSNLCENLWRAKLAQFYTSTRAYAEAYGYITLLLGAGSMICMLFGPYVLIKYGWKVGALCMPIMMLATAVPFFCSFLLEGAGWIQWPLITLLIGNVHYVVTKSVKYSIFDATKEMAFIPADDDIKSKGKAAVDIVGLRLSKATGSFAQSIIFSLSPSMSYLSMAPVMMVAVVIICVCWIRSVIALNSRYEQLVRSS